MTSVAGTSIAWIRAAETSQLPGKGITGATEPFGYLSAVLSKENPLTERILTNNSIKVDSKYILSMWINYNGLECLGRVTLKTNADYIHPTPSYSIHSENASHSNGISRNNSITHDHTMASMTIATDISLNDFIDDKQYQFNCNGKIFWKNDCDRIMISLSDEIIFINLIYYHMKAERNM